MTSPVRICMAMLATNGGSSVVAQELGQGLCKHHFEVRYCHLRADQLAQNHFLVDAAPGVKSGQLLDIPQSIAGSMDGVSEMLRIHDQWPFDLLHLHNLPVYGLSALLLKQLRGVPYIVTLHGSDLLNSHLFDQNLEVATRVLLSAAAITCVSQYLADALKRKIPKLQNIHIIHNFARASWRDVQFDCKPQPQRFLHISSMRAVKRPQLLLRAFGQLQTRLPDAQLNIVTTKEGVERVHKMLSDGLHDGTGLTVIDGDESPLVLIQEYASAKAMVLTSQFEGFGLVVLEALLHHLPVIATAVGALPEVLGDDWPYLVYGQEETELATSIADAMALAAHTEQAGTDNRLQTRMREIVARYHGPQQIEQYAELYRHVQQQHFEQQQRPISCR